MVDNKCENCGGKLQLNRILNVYQCENCGSEFSLETENKPEQLYITTGTSFLEKGDYKNAKVNFEKACELAPNNSMCWLGLIKSKTENLTVLNFDDINDINNFFSKAQNCATKEEDKLIQKDYEQYLLLEDIVKENQKNRDKNDKYFKFITIFTILIFIGIAIVNLVFTINSNSNTFWKIIDFLIVTVIEIMIATLYKNLSLRLIPSNSKKIYIHLIINIILLTTLTIVDVLFIKAI